ncbi:MAG: hypothetical protein SGJ27_15535 [Candidatus Melainabacteria bacterium]|nr:hypothetical protein [Candidatus Melainabacteria bacterium]
MASDGAETNYHISGGAPKGPDKLSLADLNTGSDSTLAAPETEQLSSDDNLRQGIYSQSAEKATGTPTDTRGDGFEIANYKTSFEKYDLTNISSMMKEFGGLELIISDPPTQLAEGSGDNLAAKAKANAQELGDSDDPSDTYNGTRETQDAIARVASALSRDSDVADRLMTTLDRLTRQKPDTKTA